MGKPVAIFLISAQFGETGEQVCIHSILSRIFFRVEKIIRNILMY